MAIAFYDSNRLLPYRHDLKQKQIEQRNQDAERTRQYIGYAGGAFANMAERTGTIFGGRLGSAPAGKYGGGTVGAQASQAAWQKGITDEENNRRDVTHKLGLLMKQVEYGNAQRDWEAWYGRDKKVLRTAYDSKWEQHLEDQRTGALTKIQLMQKYSDLYDANTNKLLNAYAATSGIEDEQEREDTRLHLEEQLKKKIISNNTFEKYASATGLYNSEVAARPRDDVNMLLAYLQEGVKFPGMNQIMQKFIADREARKGTAQDVKNQGESSDLYGDLEKARKEAVEKRRLKKKESTSTSIIEDATTKGGHFIEGSEEIPFYRFDLMLAKSEKEQEEALKKQAETDKANRIYEGRGPEYGVDESLTESKIVLDQQPANDAAYNDFIENYADKSMFDIDIIKKDSAGNDLSVVDSALSTVRVIKDVFVSKLTANKRMKFLPPAGKPLFTPADFRDRQTLAIDAQQKIRDEKNRAIAQGRIDGTGPTELEALKEKFNSAGRYVMQYLEASKGDSFGLGAEQEQMAKEQGVLTAEEAETAIGTTTTTFRQDLSLPTGDPQALSDNTTMNLLANEHGVSDGLAVEDVKHTLTAGSVDAWEIIGGDERKMTEFFEQVPMSATKKAVFMEYLNSSNPNDHLGNFKKTKIPITDIQKRRRQAMHLSPDQTKAIARWAYDHNLNNLKSRHLFLTDSVLEQYPALSQLLGDIAYRHGGGFMTGSAKNKFGLEERYPKLSAAIKKTIEARSDRDKMIGLQDMFQQLFKQGRYDVDKTDKEEKAWPKEMVGPRFTFIKDRFQKFSGSIIYPNPFQLDTFFK